MKSATDSVGNVLVKSQQGSNPVTMSYDVASRLTTTVSGAILGKYMFDHNGNMTVESVGGMATSYTYDRRNKLSVYANGLDLLTCTKVG